MYLTSLQVVVRYLWSLPNHRAAFRAIASGGRDTPLSAAVGASGSAEAGVATATSTSTATTITLFIRFANGLLNETNALVSSMLEKLMDIKEVQERMKHTEEWNAINEEEKNQIIETLRQNERICQSSSGGLLYYSIVCCNNNLSVICSNQNCAKRRSICLIT